MKPCPYCQKELKPIAFGAHKARCPQNPNRSPHPRLGKKGKNQFTKAKELGLEIPKCSEVARTKLIEYNRSRVWDEPTRKKHSDAMKAAVAKNPQSYSTSNVSGRVKTYDYNGTKLKGTWELETAKWFDRNDVRWEQVTNPFPYFWNNSWHLYFPDFYLIDLDVFVEVKGFKRDRDEAKWSQFERKHLVIDKQKIELILKGRLELKDLLAPLV